MRDIDQVIAALQRRHPDLRVEQLRVTDPADDRAIWFFRHPSTKVELQLESSAGNCPFVVESSLSPERLHAGTIGEAINMVSTILGGSSDAA